MFLRLKAYAVAAGAFLMIVLGAWTAGTLRGRKKAKQRAKDDYIKTRKEIDEADVANSSDDARSKLRERQSKRNL